jgi:hypothetical protein
VFSGELVVTTAGAALYPFLPARLRVHWAPGIPHALSLKGGTFLANLARKTRGEIAKLCPAVIAREGGRSSIPVALMMEPRSHGVLDAPPSRGMTTAY